MLADRVFSRFRSQEFDFQKTAVNKGFSEGSLAARLSLCSAGQLRLLKHVMRNCPVVGHLRRENVSDHFFLSNMLTKD